MKIFKTGAIFIFPSLAPGQIGNSIFSWAFWQLCSWCLWWLWSM